MSISIPVYVTTPSAEELEHAAAWESARNLVKMVRESPSRITVLKQRQRIWFPFLYRHRIRFSLLDVIRGEKTDFQWALGHFRPEHPWHIRAEDTDVVVMFRTKADKMMFRMAVMG
jgi:hypothetical protein